MGDGVGAGCGQKSMYTTTQAADLLRIPAVLLRWLLATEPLRNRREVVGFHKLCSAELVEEVREVLRRKDPRGEFQVGPGASGHRGRRNPRNHSTLPTSR